MQFFDLAPSIQQQIHQAITSAIEGGGGVPIAQRVPAAATGCVQSPHGNTGDKLTMGHDWLNCTFNNSSRADVEKIVTDLLGTPKPRDKGAQHYDHALAWETGAILAWSDDRRECWLSLNGDSCDMILPDHKLETFQALAALPGCKCTRLDVYLDLHRELLSMDDVRQAAQAGNVHGYRRYKDERAVANMDSGELDQDQISFGRRGKDGKGCYVRFYDKGLESDGDIDRIRCEAEYSGDRAKAWFNILCLCQDQTDFTRHLGRMATFSIDFLNRSGAHGHLDRMQTLPFWQRIVDLVGTATIEVQRIKPTLNSSIEWLKCTTGRVLARVFKKLHDDGNDARAMLQEWLSRQIARGEKLLALDGGPPESDRLAQAERILAV